MLTNFISCIVTPSSYLENARNKIRLGSAISRGHNNVIYVQFYSSVSRPPHTRISRAGLQPTISALLDIRGKNRKRSCVCLTPRDRSNFIPELSLFAFFCEGGRAGIESWFFTLRYRRPKNTKSVCRPCSCSYTKEDRFIYARDDEHQN